MIEIIPNWHPMLVHFTVGLLSLSVFLHVLARLPLSSSLRGEWRIVAEWLLWLGGVFALATAVTGWLAYNSVEHDDVSHAAMTTHRNWALPTAGVFVVLALWSAWRRITRRGPPAPLINVIFLATLVAGGVLLGSTAWHGAELVYRHGLGVMSLPNNKPVPAATPGTAPDRPPAKKQTAHDHSAHPH
ncbi:MAG: DUF2231 domain-containing protein [Pseudomonadota bacterium]